MKKRYISITLLILVITLSLVGIPMITAGQNYAKVPSPTHSETKAICTQGNFCEDYELFCQNTDLIGLRPTGFAAQFSGTWQDTRTAEEKEISCKN